MYTTSNPSVPKRRRQAGTTSTRPLSASQIAKSVKNFEMWATYHGLSQVAFSDLPEEMNSVVNDVLNFDGVIPSGWVDPSCKAYAWLRQCAPQPFLNFLEEAHQEQPRLFSSSNSSGSTSDESSKLLLFDLMPVFSSWQTAVRMSTSAEQYTEQDFADNVYNGFRSHGMQSVRRVRCSVALPRPSTSIPLSKDSLHVLTAKSAVPDSCVFLPSSFLRPLCHTQSSPFKSLQAHPRIRKKGTGTRGSSFRFQATPALNPGNDAGFEFCSSVWEDKKEQHLVEDAYRQNRLSSASVVRHLHSMKVKAPVWGTIWSGCMVRAHIDWWEEDDDGALTICSAPYSPRRKIGRSLFHEWDLCRPSDILCVYFLLRHIDEWTLHQGVNALHRHVVKGGGTYRPWRNLSDLKDSVKENISTSSERASVLKPKKATVKPTALATKKKRTIKQEEI
ncbi:hypothetical protein DL96DRAFT_1576023 [Flagelloscypha sp. PMI_526]|nr:hypothetical protein DL96DRAFT_1576023 [Flagelloscypha sp. PMI_526]